MFAPANLRPDNRIQWTTVNLVHGEPGLAFSVCDNHQQAINSWAAPRFLLQSMLNVKSRDNVVKISPGIDRQFRATSDALVFGRDVTRM